MMNVTESQQWNLTQSTTTAVQKTKDLKELTSHLHDLLDETEAAKYLSIGVGTLSVWRSTGRYKLIFIKVGRKVRYRRADLDDWLTSRTRVSGATAGDSK